jgi:uncharacterized membrane protein YphA (DoxX/SURF4 family)
MSLARSELGATTAEATPGRRSASFARVAPAAARIVLGLLFFVFGLNGFFDFIPRPSTPPPPQAMTFIGALLSSGYMFPLIKGTEVVAGVALLSNRFVPLALTVLAPIVLNILLFHTILAPSGAAIAFLVLGLELYLAWAHRERFAPMLAART